MKVPRRLRISQVGLELLLLPSHEGEPSPVHTAGCRRGCIEVQVYVEAVQVAVWEAEEAQPSTDAVVVVEPLGLEAVGHQKNR